MSQVSHTSRSIFRATALQRYAWRREQPVLPRFVAPPTFLALWMILVLLIAGGCAVWLVEVPVYASGPAIIVRASAQPSATGVEVVAVAFVPPEDVARLRAGQMMLFSLDGASARLSWPIQAVETEISSPSAARRRFALDGGAALAISRPAAVAIARLEPLPADLPASLYVGSVGRADIEIGSCRLLALAPLIGPAFGGCR